MGDTTLPEGEPAAAEGASPGGPAAHRKRKMEPWAAGAPGLGSSPGKRPLKVAGPASIQILRGRLLEREVALVCCGEAHEDAIDLTRRRCVIEPKRGWIDVPRLDGAGFDPAEALAKKGGVTLEAAKKWARRKIEDEVEEGEAYLVFDAEGPKSTARGVARIFETRLPRVAEHPLPPGASVCEWADLDDQAREFNRRRLAGDEVPAEDQDRVIAERKQARLAEGVELFDDWLIRHAKDSHPYVQLILEAPVPAHEVELHCESGHGAAPAAHECLRQMELDSDTDCDDEADPDDGSGSFIDYLQRRVAAHLRPDQVHGIDPRQLGDDDSDDPAKAAAFQALLPGPQPKDVEEVELDAAGAEDAVAAGSASGEAEPAADGRRRRRTEDGGGGPPPKDPVPSWEAYFGVASELLYYSPNIKADYAPFLVACVGSAGALQRFFQALYFRTVPEALAEVRVDTETWPLTRLRSLAYRPAPGGPLLRRPSDQGLVPVRAAPLDRYLKARGAAPPRTWVSGLAERLRRTGAEDVVAAAEAWWLGSVQGLLSNPKEADLEGDYFVAWLRACHRDVYDDIDRSDPEKLRSMQSAPSQSHPRSRKHRHDLKGITIPGIESAFAELVGYDPTKRPSTNRERVLAKIFVDIFQLRIVDVAAILKVADVVASVPQGARVVVVIYAGGDHTDSVVEFWRAQGLGHGDLPHEGFVGKESWEDHEPRALDLPACLHDLGLLFPA